MQVTLPYLHSQYGRDVVASAGLPVKLLDILQDCKAEQRDQQVVVLEQVKCCMPAVGSGPCCWLHTQSENVCVCVCVCACARACVRVRVWPICRQCMYPCSSSGALAMHRSTCQSAGFSVHPFV